MLKIVVVALAALACALLLAGLYLYHLSCTLPDIKVGSASFAGARTSVVYAADGSPIAEWHADQDRTLVPYASLPPQMMQAVVSIEDERFYQHNGVDLRAILRAARVDAGSGGYRQGGSTITQQVVKLLFTDGRRTIGRKIREVLLAYELEAKADKQQVMETYLNLVYFGDGKYGVQTAAEHYFGKPAEDLTLAECATLAGTISSPGRCSPTLHPVAARARRDVVLAKMAELGYIDAAQERSARAEPLGVVKAVAVKEVAPYFVDYVKRQLIAKLGAQRVFRGGLRVYTTLDRDMQRAAEKSARTVLGGKDDPSVALVCLDHGDGRIKAMVGGKDFSTDKFNLATQGRRQPGSAFKPFVLVAALENGLKPTDVFSAAPCSVRVKDGVWNVQNYENKVTSGSMSLEAATNWSVNAVFARLIMRVGPQKVVDAAKAMGITSPLQPDPAIALGGLSTGVSPLEMASAYGTIADDGVHVSPSAIIKVADDSGRTLMTSEPTGTRAIPRKVARSVSLMLHDVVERGTGQGARLTTWTAGKTGTTQGYRDAWFVGYSGRLVTAVWVGHPEGQVAMTDVHGTTVTGGSFPAAIWQRFMSRALSGGSGVATPVASSGVSSHRVLVTICTDTFLLANPRCPNTVQVYLDPKEIPSGICTKH